MTSEEVAEQVGTSPAAARMLLCRARRRLERLLEPLCRVPREEV
jgi:DNA-directed RNA polymerase specialized sigma24 family protein